MNDYDKISNVFLYRVFHISHVTPREKSDLRSINISVEFTFFHDGLSFHNNNLHYSFNTLVFFIHNSYNPSRNNARAIV